MTATTTTITFDGIRHGAKKEGTGPGSAGGFLDECSALGLLQVTATWSEYGAHLPVEIHHTELMRTHQCADAIAARVQAQHVARPPVIMSPEIGYTWTKRLNLPAADHHATRDRLVTDMCGGDPSKLMTQHWLLSGLGEISGYAGMIQAWMQLTAKRLAVDHPNGARVLFVSHSPVIGLAAPDPMIKTLGTAGMYRFPVHVEDGQATIQQPTRFDCPLGGGMD